MNNIYSCRKIEKHLLRDIHYIWLAGNEHPDFITINRFRNRVKEEINNVFTQLVLVLADKGFISLDVEYIDGFNGLPVDDYSLSFNTYRNYVHYRIALPNEEVRFRLSGNYAVLVYPEGNPDSLLLTACFSITENLVALGCEITTRTDVDYNKAHQQLSFKVMYPRYEIRNPREELKVSITTNVGYDYCVTVS